MKSVDILEFKEVMAETIDLVKGWKGSDQDKRRLSCLISCTSLLAPEERRHVAVSGNKIDTRIGRSGSQLQKMK
jgi:hypothetical protein